MTAHATLQIVAPLGLLVTRTNKQLKHKTPILIHRNAYYSFIEQTNRKHKLNEGRTPNRLLPVDMTVTVDCRNGSDLGARTVGNRKRRWIETRKFNRRCSSGLRQ